MTSKRLWAGLVRNDSRSDEGTLRFKLFDLSEDAEELIDRWPQRPIVGMALRQMLRAHLMDIAQTGRAAPEPISLDEIDRETLESLRALGYLR